MTEHESEHRGVIRANCGEQPSPIVGAHGGIPIRDAEVYARGQKLAWKRKALGISEKQMAARLGVSVWDVVDVEAGVGGVSMAEYDVAITRTA
jgi:predicted transcriptional regulator